MSEAEKWEPMRHFDVPHLMRDQAERENVVAAYFAGVAAAMDVIRAYDFPLTERVDHIAEELAPNADR